MFCLKKIMYLFGNNFSNITHKKLNITFGTHITIYIEIDYNHSGLTV
jgi:hypothetical protein